MGCEAVTALFAPDHCFADRFAQEVAESRKGFSRISHPFAECGVQDLFRGGEGLKVEAPGAFEPFSDLYNIRFRQPVGVKGGAEFVGNSVFKQVLNALFNTPDGFRGSAHFGVSFKGNFDVHGDVINQSFPDPADPALRPRAVGVQFNAVVQGLDPGNEGADIKEGGFSAGNTDPFKEIPAGFEKPEKRGLAGAGRRAGGNQVGIVTVGTAEVAPGREDRAGYVTGKVHDGKGLKIMKRGGYFRDNRRFWRVVPCDTGRKGWHGQALKVTRSLNSSCFPLFQFLTGRW